MSWSAVHQCQTHRYITTTHQDGAGNSPVIYFSGSNVNASKYSQLTKIKVRKLARTFSHRCFLLPKWLNEVVLIQDTKHITRCSFYCWLFQQQFFNARRFSIFGTDVSSSHIETQPSIGLVHALHIIVADVCRSLLWKNKCRRWPINDGNCSWFIIFHAVGFCRARR